jgi:hypothetical protein
LTASFTWFWSRARFYLILRKLIRDFFVQHQILRLEMSPERDQKQPSLEESGKGEEKSTTSQTEFNASDAVDDPPKKEQAGDKEDSAAARARERKERFKALQARAVSALGHITTS